MQDRSSMTMASTEAAAASIVSTKQQAPLPPPAKKKRSLPGTPDPDAEVIALSPRTLLATNRFVCEICGKGFQRDQNLQLHRRGHNLPWKLRQRSGKEPRKRVYVCPEASCVHHNPSRALGDLTGIKKHFCRKHGEKKWKCDKCSKRYAVQSDWKAHSKTCGTREYRCDCGTLFSRRDSFITHRAFCDALAEETARLSSAAAATSFFAAAASPPGLAAALPVGPSMVQLPLVVPPAPAAGLSLWGGGGNIACGGGGVSVTVPSQLYADLFAQTTAAPPQLGMGAWLYGSGKLASSNSNATSELTSALAAAPAPGKTTDSVPSAFSGQEHAKHAAPTDMSATALLQKAAQMGAVTSSGAAGNALVLEPAPNDQADEECHRFVDGGGPLLFGASQQNANSLLCSMPYDAVLSAVRHAGQLKDAVGSGIGREETRDFLGVGVQALCSSSLNGWI